MQNVKSPYERWRKPLWLGVLVAASVAFSTGFACVTPFAAFAAIAALTLAPRDGLVLVGAVWLANQAVGYLFLGYPWTADSLAWGAAIGVASVIALAASRPAARATASAGPVSVVAAALLVGFAVFETALLAATAVLGGGENFAPAIVAQLFAVNVAAFAGLLLLDRIGAAAGIAVRRGISLRRA